MARLGRHHHRAAVGTLVVEDAHAAVRLPHHEHRFQTDARLAEIAGLRHLAFMADIDPGAAEDAFHLERKNPGIGVERAMDAPRQDARAKLGCGDHRAMLAQAGAR